MTSLTESSHSMNACFFFVVIDAPAASPVDNATVIAPAAVPAVIAVTTIITAIPDCRRSWVLHSSRILSSLRVLVTVCLHCGYL